MNKTINVGLDVGELTDLVKKLKQLSNDMKKLPDLLVEEVAHDGFLHLNTEYSLTPQDNNLQDINTDYTQERDTHRGNDRSQQHGGKPQPLYVDAHGLGGSFTAEQSIEFPGHQHEINNTNSYHCQHNSISAVSSTAQITKIPDNSRR